MLNESIEIYQNNLEPFARDAMPILNPSDLIPDDAYLEVLFDLLEEVATGKTSRGLVNMPPRHLKTMSGVALAAWVLGRDPTTRVMIVSYAKELSERIADLVRTLLKSKYYRSIFGDVIGKTDRKSFVQTKNGGYVLAMSPFGSITGQGADLIIVDDPHKISDAGWPETIERTISFFDSVVMTRLNDPKRGRVVVLAHRIAEDDLSGNLIKRTGWKHLCLPMIATCDVSFHIKSGRHWHRKIGEILRPWDFGEKEIGALKTSLKFPDFETLYQQNPSAGFTPIDASSFRRFAKSERPRHGTVLSMDWATSVKEGASFSVAQVWRYDGSGFYLIQQYRARCDFDELVRASRRLIVKYRASVVLIEEGTLAGALESGLRTTNVVRLFVRIPTEGKSKLERAAAIRPLIDERRVYLPKQGEWLGEFLEEVTLFPNSANNDQLDAMSQALSWLRSNPPLPPPPPRDLGWGPPPRGFLTGRVYIVPPRR